MYGVHAVGVLVSWWRVRCVVALAVSVLRVLCSCK